MMDNHNTNINGLLNGPFQSVLLNLAASVCNQELRHAILDLESFNIEVH